MHLDREPAVRRRDEHAATDPERLRYELALPRASTHVLDHGVREDDVERAVREGQRARVALDVGDVRVAGAETFAVVQAERRDALGPRIALLEEVQRRAAVSVPEAELVGSDVEHRRRGRRPQLVEKEPQLSLSRAQRDGVGEPHRLEVSAPHGLAGWSVGWLDGRRRAPGRRPVLPPTHRARPDVDSTLARWTLGVRASAVGRADRRSRLVRARGRGGAIHAGARRRHHGVPSPTCARPAHRACRAAAPGPATATQGHSDARGRPRDLGPADPGVEGAPDRAGDHPRRRRGPAHARVDRAALAGPTDRLRAGGKPRYDSCPTHAHARPRRAAHALRRPRAARSRARSRPVDGRRRRAAGPRSLRRRPRRRSRAREAPRLAAPALARTGRDRRAAGAVRRMAGARERVPAPGIPARSRPRSERGSSAARPRSGTTAA